VKAVHTIQNSIIFTHPPTHLRASIFTPRINLLTYSIVFSLRSRPLRSKAPTTTTSTISENPTFERCPQTPRPILNYIQGSAASILLRIPQLSTIGFGNQSWTQSQDFRRPKSCPALTSKGRSTGRVRTRGRWHAAPVG
jgi:hypothetical protein